MSVDETIDEPEQDLQNSAQLGAKSGQTLPIIMLQRALGRRLKLFVEGKALCAVVRVKTPEWVGPIAAASRIIAGWTQVVDSDAAERNRDKVIGAALTYLATGRRVLFVVPIDTPLPPPLLAAADLIVDVDTIERTDIGKAIHIMTERRARGLSTLPFSGLELPQAMAAIRVGTTAASCIRRLRGSGTTAAVDQLVLSAPGIEDLHGYGEASLWAKRLVHDLDLWRAGELEFSAIQRRVVLAGPPGVGKSTFARSLAKSTGLPLVVSSVGRMFATTAGYLDSIVKAIDALFAAARAAGPSCIVLIDELEGFPNRATLEGRHASWWIPVVNHMLTSLDGALASDATNLIIVGATNHPDLLDAALVRPGRLDRIIWIDHPDETALEGIYRQHLGSDLESQDLAGIAALSVGSTGADVAGHIQGARARAREGGRRMQLQDLIDEVFPPSTLSETDRWRACIHESGHAVASVVLGGSTVKSIAVTRGAQGSVGRVVYSDSESGVHSVERTRRITTRLLAGRAAEEVLLGHASGGAGGGEESDLAKASTMVATAHLSLGLRRTLVHLADPDQALAAARRSPHLLKAIEDELGEHYAAALDLVRDNADAVLALAGCLRDERVLSGTRMLEIVRGHLSANGGLSHA